MAARALASVTVSFGMVSIPVKLYTATQAQAGVSFNLLHAACGSRLKQQYLCAREGVVVERADMVKGYEFSKDQYVTFTPEELKELEEKGTQTIEISEFVPAESIDPIYYDKAYFLGPDKGGAKPYALLAESMRQTRQTAVGRYAARGKQYIVQLRAVPGGLVMQQLLYAPEVRALADIGIEDAPVRDTELALAKQLIAQISSKQFDPSAYEDDVKKRIEAAVQKKVEGEEIAISPSAPETGAQVIDSPVPGSFEVRYIARGYSFNDKDFAASGVLARIIENRIKEKVPAEYRSGIRVRSEGRILPGFISVGMSGVASTTVESKIEANDLVSAAIQTKITDTEFNSAKAAYTQEWNAKNHVDRQLDIDTYKMVSIDDQRQTVSGLTAADVQRVADALSKQPVAVVVLNTSKTSN